MVFLRSIVISFLLCFIGMNCTMSSQPKFLYKVLTVDVWKESQKQDAVVVGSFDRPFIHLAEESQVDRIIKKFFPKDKSVMLLKLRVESLLGHLVYESNPGGSSKYWHLYEGSIPLKAVEAANEVSGGI